MDTFTRPSHYMAALCAVGLALLLVLPRSGTGDPSAPERPPRLVRTGSGTSGKNLESPALKLTGRILLEDPGPADRVGDLDLDMEIVPLGRGLHASEGVRSFEADASGTFELAGLASGRYLLRALPRDDAPFLPIATEIECSPENPKLEIDLILPRPRFLLGRLEDDSREPRAGLFVTVQENGLQRGTAPSDDHGRFRIPAVGHGPYEFLVRDGEGRPKAFRAERVAETRPPSMMGPGRVEATLVVP